MFWFISRNFSCQSQCQNTAPREPFRNVSAKMPTTRDLLHSLLHSLSDLETHLPFKFELSKTSPPIHPQHHLYQNIKKKAKKFYPFTARIKPHQGQSLESSSKLLPLKDKRIDLLRAHFKHAVLKA